MVSEYCENVTEAQFIMHSSNSLFTGVGLGNPAPIPVNTFVYNKQEAQVVTVDEIPYTMPSNSILPLVSNQTFVFQHPEYLTAWQFNREFYCIVDHDTEVGCAGFLFYGIKHPMFILLNPDQASEITYLEKMVFNEMLVKDNFQGEMLRTLLKRLIIKTTRIAKSQNDSYSSFPEDRMDIVRKFSMQLEKHFKKQHKVSFYASVLHKSPKTLSNVFALLKQPSPSSLIRNRLFLEAKRYFHYTELSAKEIAYELGFESPAHFSRFFKRFAGTTISIYRNN